MSTFTLMKEVAKGNENCEKKFVFIMVFINSM